jgi:hypothetical protein
LNGWVFTDAPLECVFDATITQPGPRGILQCYAGGSNARHIIALDEEKRIAYVTEQMSAFYPTYIARPWLVIVLDAGPFDRLAPTFRTTMQHLGENGLHDSELQFSVIRPSDLPLSYTA